MATAYLDKLTRLMAELDLVRSVDADLEIRHFFSGAALYANARICASWSPVGLAFKLPDADALIASGKAEPLRYFDAAPVKKGYALFPNPETLENQDSKQYFLNAIDQVS